METGKKNREEKTDKKKIYSRVHTVVKVQSMFLLSSGFSL